MGGYIQSFIFPRRAQLLKADTPAALGMHYLFFKTTSYLLERLPNSSYKYYYDQSYKTFKSYSVGDHVMITNVEIVPGENKKLIPKFKRPCKVKAVFSNDRYLVTDFQGF